MIDTDMAEEIHKRNLERLCEELTRYATTTPGQAPPTPAPEAALLFLAHSTSEEKLSRIQANGLLLSTKRVHEGRRETVPADRPEVILGTDGSVFLYAAAFRYPNTNCGLLFAPSLEEDHEIGGTASPFDSGGLIHHIARPDPAEDPRDFLRRHELPLPGYRKYLGLCMAALFSSPWAYVEGEEPIRACPLGLTGGDARRWTHEVRIPNRVFLRSPHLQAVFSSRKTAGSNPHIEALLEWCLRNGVDFEVYDSAPDEFSDLQRACYSYLRRKLQWGKA